MTALPLPGRLIRYSPVAPDYDLVHVAITDRSGYQTFHIVAAPAGPEEMEKCLRLHDAEANAERDWRRHC